MSLELQHLGQVAQGLADVNTQMQQLVAVFREMRDLLFFSVYSACPQTTFWPSFEQALHERSGYKDGELLVGEGGDDDV